MENEIMNVETNDTNEVEFTEGSGMGVGMLIGAAVTGAAIAVFNWGKKKYADHKAKKTKGVIKFKDEEKNDEENVTVE